MECWGIPFDHIENNWTDRQYLAHVNALAKIQEDRAKAQGGGKGKRGAH